jgi:FMN phosphatase YigB (HAD superfamily)
MPEKYAREMIADWLGASKAYTGSWDMTDWLNKNYNKIIVHKNTHAFIQKVLREIGYDFKQGHFSRT